MAKSWGTRIVGLLFGLRSQKKADADGDETPNLEERVEDSLPQHDSESYDELPAKDSDEFSDQIKPETGDEAAPTKGASKAQLNVGKPDKLKMSTLSVPPEKENADESVIPLSNSAPKQKSSPVRVTKPQSGRLADKASGAGDGEGMAISETSERQSAVGNGRRKQKPDYGAQELVSAKNTVAALEPSSDWDLLKVGQRREKNSANPKAPTSPFKRSRKPKPKAMDEQVTDEELAELEAENIRLKLLLSQELN